MEGKLYLVAVLLLFPYFSAFHIKMMAFSRYQDISSCFFIECTQCEGAVLDVLPVLLELTVFPL